MGLVEEIDIKQMYYKEDLQIYKPINQTLGSRMRWQIYNSEPS